MIVVLTGAFGFVGSELLRSLLHDQSISRVDLLVRGKFGLTPQQRYDALVADWIRYFKIDNAVLTKVRIIPFDLSSYCPLPDIKDASLFIHCAASVDFSLPLVPSRKANLIGTQRMLRLARSVVNLDRFVHISTAFVAGNRKGRVHESDHQTHFNNGYEKSKYEAEQCVKHSGLPYTILRPSIVVGHSKHGYIRGFKVFYAMIRLWLLGRIPRAPIDPKAMVDLVPVDYVVQCIRLLALDPAAKGNTIHLTSGEQATNPLKLFNYAIKTFNLEKPKLSPSWVAVVLCAPILRRFIPHSLLEVVDVIKFHIPYLGTRSRIFDSSKSRQLLKNYHVDCPSIDCYGDKLFLFCKESQWGKNPYFLGE